MTVGVNHRNEVIALFSTGGTLNMDRMDRLLDLAHAQCMANTQVVKKTMDRFCKLDIS